MIRTARYGFDLDGTVSDNPEIAHLARALGKEGHKIIIVTASDAGKDAIKAKLYSINIEWYHKLVIVQGETDDEIGQAKGKACNKNKVSVFFDNNPGVLAGFAKTSKIARVQVLDDEDPSATPRREIEAECTGRDDYFQCPVHGEVHGSDWDMRSTRYDEEEKD